LTRSESKKLELQIVIPTDLNAPVPQGLFMQYFVYILQSVSTGRFYAGQTYDLDKRFAERNSKLVGHALKEQPWKIVWLITVETRKEAIERNRH